MKRQLVSVENDNFFFIEQLEKRGVPYHVYMAQHADDGTACSLVSVELNDDVTAILADECVAAWSVKENL